jgi:predicted nucleic acid-binding protein
LHRGDAAHSKAAALAEKITNPLVTTAWVLTEVGDALSAPKLRPRFVQLVEALRTDPACSIVPPSAALFDAGVLLYAERSDKDWTLTDCISFAVMREYGITEALTGDHHFQQAGFIPLLL